MIDLSYCTFKGQVAARNADLLEHHLRRTSRLEVEFGGLRLSVFPGVFDPTMGEGSRLLLRCCNDLAGAHVLDVGTGTGALAIIAAKAGATVVASDCCQVAAACARHNVAQAGVGERVEVRTGDLFSPIGLGELFDVVVFNPPFLLGTGPSSEFRAMYDLGYQTLCRFFQGVMGVLKPEGRVLLCFGEVGDIAYLNWLVRSSHLRSRVVASLVQDNLLFFVLELVHEGQQGTSANG